MFHSYVPQCLRQHGNGSLFRKTLEFAKSRKKLPPCFRSPYTRTPWVWTLESSCPVRCLQRYGCCDVARMVLLKVTLTGERPAILNKWSLQSKRQLLYPQWTKNSIDLPMFILGTFACHLFATSTNVVFKFPTLQHMPKSGIVGII